MDTTKISITQYSAEEVHQKFQELLDSFDFAKELEHLAIPRYAIFKKRKAVQELRILCVALWKLALERSFPHHADEFFTSYSKSSLFFTTQKKGVQVYSRLMKYVDLLQEKKDSDFMPVASHFLSSIRVTEEKTSLLKTSLALRDLYNTIFKYLV